jgi:preprotein translocase subunit SecA
MKSKQLSISQKIKDMYSSIEYDTEQYQSLLVQIGNIKLETFSDDQLKQKSRELREKVQQEFLLDDLLVEAYALVREASRRVLGLHPYDVQIMAAVAIHQGKMVEMQTGEGKTLTAVMPAYLNAIAGKGVHVLTFNDYLAGRDATWMGPIYEFLGLTVGYINENMNIQERHCAYHSDITYVTAKEAGFDYLRDFLCTDKTQLVHRDFNFAIIDEGDSILIDEARIPLVIAGSAEENTSQYLHLSSLVRTLKPEQDYEFDEYDRNVFLTDNGLIWAEKALGCGNLYENHNLNLLARLSSALHAELLLKKDKDYILRNGKIEIVDEFTGRIADKRHWPDMLQAAVEAKEGVLPSSKGVIMGSIALQHFISLYPKLSGMTGTAKTAAVELNEFYHLTVAVIPTNKPCIRVDHKDLIYADFQAKQKAIISEVQRIHQKGQPILIGTVSVEESEQLAEALSKEGIVCNILNAKNDMQEAAIIAKAGEFGAVTVSTNMAGRGVDIKLGGIKGEEHAKVTALGGLYIISTNRHESPRIDNQLRGRSGRQGDPGESRFYISLEDEWIKKYEVLKALSTDYLLTRQKELIVSPEVRNTIIRGQRIVEGYHSDLRAQQWKYSFIVEQQRRIIHKWRQDILTDHVTSELLSQNATERYSALAYQYGSELVEKVERQLTLHFINKHWADYLDYISYIKENIHLMAIGKLNPLYEFNKQAVRAFEELLIDIDEDIVKTFKSAEITKNGINMEREGLKAPTSTWTYLINDNSDQFSNLAALMKAVSSAVKGPLFTIRSLYGIILKRIRKTDK